MDKILHYLKDPKLWELGYIPYNGQCRILSINSIKGPLLFARLAFQDRLKSNCRRAHSPKRFQTSAPKPQTYAEKG